MKTIEELKTIDEYTDEEVGRAVKFILEGRTPVHIIKHATTGVRAMENKELFEESVDIILAFCHAMTELMEPTVFKNNEH